METNRPLADYYTVLQCERTATNEQLKKSFQRLALSTHPDKQSSADDSDKFALVQRAWSVLRDPESRRLYDATLSCQDHSELLLFETISLRDMQYDTNGAVYRYNCRCGGTYLLDANTSSSQVVIGCDECSFSIQVNL